MKVGITVPQFRADATPSLLVAERAEAAGLDGVFVFDHLWPIGRPGEPALHGVTLLSALAQATSSIRVGMLVARAGVVPTSMLAQQLRTVDAIAGAGRVIAGLGAGDSLSRGENEAYGIQFARAADRVAAMRDVAVRVLDDGLEVWVGGRSAAVERVAVELGIALNLWGVTPEELAVRATEASVELTWGGTADVARTAGEVAAPRPLVMAGTISDVAAAMALIAAAGATWAVIAPPYARPVEEEVERVAEVARLLAGTTNGAG